MCAKGKDPQGGFHHPALLYSDPDHFLRAMVPFVEAGIEEGEFVFVAARGDNLHALRGGVGKRGASVRWENTEEWHPHPATRLRAFYELVTDELAAGARRLRLVGELVWPPGPPELVREWQRYESVLNLVLAPFPVTLLCLYDASGLESSLVETARVTHPMIQRHGAVEESEMYEAPEVFLRRFNPSLAAPPATATTIVVTGAEGLAKARRFVSEQAVRWAVAPAHAMEMCIGANEVLSNALVHARSSAVLSAWTADSRFICQIEDAGPGIGDAIAGYRPPTDKEGGRGLWLTRQLMHLLQIVPGPSGTSVRLYAPIG